MDLVVLKMFCFLRIFHVYFYNIAGKPKPVNVTVKVEPVVHREIKKYQSIANMSDYLHRLEGDVKAYVTQLPEEK